MEEKNPSSNSFRTVTVRIVTDKPVKKTPYQVKGVFIKQFADNKIIPMLNGQYRKEFLYPRVQVKILNEQIYLVGLNEGVDLILSLCKKLDVLDFGNITFQINDLDVDHQTDIMMISNQPVRYRFISPWVALNPVTNKRYKDLDNSGSIKYLSQLLTQNILFLGKEMGIKLDTKVYTWLSLSSLSPKPIGEKKWGSFYGGFKTNFILPNYIGLGNGITRGYGTIFGLFDTEESSFDEKDLKENLGEKPSSFLSEKNPKKDKSVKFHFKNNVSNKKYKGKVSTKQKSKSNNNSKKKEKKVFSKSVNNKKYAKDTDKVNFNSMKYHEKQHDI